MKLNITKLLSSLILAARAADSRIPRGVLSIQSRALEYGTIRLHAHRQAGHTHALKELATPNSLVLTMDTRHIQHFSDSPFMVCSSRSFRKQVKGREFDSIFIDNASYCRTGDLKRLYDPGFLKTTFGDRFPLLVFLG